MPIFNSKSILFFFITIIILFRLWLPGYLKAYVNYSLENNLNYYKGSIQDLDLFLLKGAYYIDDLSIYKKNSLEDPFFKSDRIEVSLDWRMLFKGVYSLRLEVKNSEILFITSHDETKKQIAIDENKSNWVKALKAVLPLSIEAVEVENLKISYQNKNLKGLEKSEINVSKMEIEYLLDPEEAEYALSPFHFKSIVNKHSKLVGYGGIDLTQSPPFISVDAEMRSFDLTSLNKLLRHYVPIDFTSGHMDTYFEFKGNLKKANGYFKFFLSDVDVLRISQKFKSVDHIFFEFIGSFANWILSVITDENIATEVPFEFKDHKFKIDTSAAFWNSLENSWDYLEKGYNNL